MGASDITSVSLPACLLQSFSQGFVGTPFNMARYFKETDIDEFRECFYLYARSGQISTMDELTEIMNGHSKKESIPRELLEAFRGMDPQRKGYIPAKDLWHILAKWGEKLSPREVDQIFREANIHPSGQVKYEEFVKIVCAPVPDYY